MYLAIGAYSYLIMAKFEMLPHYACGGSGNETTCTHLMYVYLNVIKLFQVNSKKSLTFLRFLLRILDRTDAAVRGCYT